MNWYAVYTRYGREFYVEERLNWQAFETYLPMFKKKFIGAKRAYYEPRPLFPTYLFVRLDLNKNGWGNVLSTSGVRGLVANGRGDNPIAVSELAINSIKSREAMGYVQFKEPRRLLVGQRVKVLEGPWFDNFGELQYLDDRERAKVLLEIFGRKTIVQLLSCHLEPADNQMTVNSGRSPQRAAG